jgi:hypothetical protein
MLLSVDPGVRGCGVALWTGQLKGHELIAAAYVRNPKWRGQGSAEANAMAKAVFEWVTATPGWGRYGPLHLAIECPRVYQAAHQLGDQNTSIIPLTLVVGAVAGWAGSLYVEEITQYFPRDWKGTVDPDEVMIPRIKERLNETERTRVQLPTADDLAHNVWDGVGVGLKLLGRLEPRRVFAREP